MSFLERMPFSDVVGKSKVVISGLTDTMITRVPWQPGANKYYTLRKVTINSAGGSTNPATITFWDRDLSSATPPVRGNASTGALYIASTAVQASGFAGNFVAGLNEIPRIRFEAGVTVQSTNSNTSICLELEMH